jgi:hypothetical protein
MPLQQAWLVPDETGMTPADRWLGTLRALYVEAVQVLNRLRVGGIEGGVGLTTAQKTTLLNWYDDWLMRLNNHVKSGPS